MIILFLYGLVLIQYNTKYLAKGFSGFAKQNSRHCKCSLKLYPMAGDNRNTVEQLNLEILY